MNPILHSIKLKRLPADPVGYVPVMARGIYSLESPGGISFLPIIVRSSREAGDMPMSLIEIMPSREEAQELLEFYLARFTPSCGMGTIRPVTLAEVFFCLSAHQVAVNDRLAEVIQNLFFNIRELPVVSCHWQMSWKDTWLAKTNYRLVGVIGKKCRQTMREVSRYLKAARGKKISGKAP